MQSHRLRLPSAPLAAVILAILLAPLARSQEEATPTPVVQQITDANTKIEISVNGSRILAMDRPIPKAKVDNPELLDFTVLSEKQVLIHAKKTGMTTIDLWDDKDEIHRVDVVIVGDVRELSQLLRTQFPMASVKLTPTGSSSLLLHGYVDRADHVNRIIRIAEEYYPTVINNMTVGGAQQVLLYVKVLQVSRTKLRTLGVDGMGFSGENYGGSVVSGLITKANPTTSLLRNVTAFSTNGTETMQFGLLSDGNGFVGMIEALKQDDILKVMAEPKLVTVSGRPAVVNVGGEVAYPQPTGFGNISVAFRPFGTQIDFVPIVLGNGGVRLEVRPRVSEVDYTLGTSINGTAVPGFRVREADTGVEMKFGQTLAIAGLLSQIDEHETKGIPYLMDMPYAGALFRRTRNKVNEVELLILVQPELVEAMDCDQVPPCGPGENSSSPDDCGLYWKGYREVPVPVGPGMGPGPGPGGVPPLHEEVTPPQPVEEMPKATRRTPAGQSVTITDAPAAQRGPVSVARRPTVGQGTPTQTRVVSHNPSNPQAPRAQAQSRGNSAPPGFIGPTGYDVRK